MDDGRRGIIHQEIPRPSPHMLGIQLWLNLPGKEKMTLPKYRDIRKENIPVVRSSKYTARLLSGYLDDMAGAIQSDYVPVTFLDITLYAGESFTMQTDPRDTIFAYILMGEGSFGTLPAVHGPKQALLFDQGDSFVAWREKSFFVSCSSPGARFTSPSHGRSHRHEYARAACRRFS